MKLGKRSITGKVKELLYRLVTATNNLSIRYRPMISLICGLKGEIYRYK